MQDKLFISLVEAVEEDGGELLAETHYPKILNYTAASGGPMEGTGCNQEWLLRVPYDHTPSAPDGSPAGLPRLHDVKVCAWDDRVDLWPRFASRISAE